MDDTVQIYKDNEEIINFLTQSRLFGHLEKEFLNQLIPLSSIIKCERETIIIQEATLNNFVYFLIRGEVGVYAEGNLILTLRRIGDIFGEMSIISDKKTSASVIANTPVTLFRLQAKAVSKYSALDPSKIQNMLYRVFAMILTEKLSLTTHKAKQHEEAIKELEAAKEEFKLFIPRQFVDRQNTDIREDPLLPGHRLQEEPLVIFFSDIRSFTTFSERMSSEEIFDFLNEYLKVVEPCITAHNGFIDKFIGDATMAVFQSVDDAVKASIDIDKAITKYNRKRIKEGKNSINFGIGIHYGMAMIGLLGTPIRLDSTVIGDSVNFASRLESLTKQYGCHILISESAYDALSNKVYARLIDKVRVKGRQKSEGVYEVFEGAYSVAKEKLESKEFFEKGFNLYLESKFDEAERLFQQCSEICMSDLISRIYISRCRYYKKFPPPSDWDGVFQKRAYRADLHHLKGSLYFIHKFQRLKTEIEIINISETGLLISISREEKIFIGEEVNIEFIFEHLMLSVFCVTLRYVVNDNPDYEQYGLHFNDLSTSQKGTLSILMKSLTE